MQAVFDDLYDAATVEAESKTKWNDVEPERIAEKSVAGTDGKEKKEKRFVYDVIQPKGAFSGCAYPDEKWLALWRDMLWKTLRSKPASRGLFKERPKEIGPRSSAMLNQACGRNSSRQRLTLRRGSCEQTASPARSSLGAQDANADAWHSRGAIAT